jgi:hypothetical protein
VSRVTENPKPNNSVLVDIQIGHKEIMSSWTAFNGSCQHPPQARANSFKRASPRQLQATAGSVSNPEVECTSITYPLAAREG